MTSTDPGHNSGVAEAFAVRADGLERPVALLRTDHKTKTELALEAIREV